MGSTALKVSSMYENGVKVKKGSCNEQKYAEINNIIFKVF
jgi:hypothetical protein